MERRRDENRRHGEMSVCPGHVARRCPEPRPTVKKKCRKIDADRAIEKLRQLVSDPVTDAHVSRISRLLRDYLAEIDEEGYQVKHLPIVIKVLEFLAPRIKKVKDCEAHLERMLQLCGRPPLFERASDCLTSSAVLEDYFTSLGRLLTVLPHENIQRVHEALDRLLIGRTKPENVAAVKLDFRRRAVENSKLPIVVVELLETASPRTYPRNVELAFVLASVSCRCCHRMLEAGVLNTLLGRMDRPYATQTGCTVPPDAALEGEEYSWDITLLMTSLLWSLMRSILPPRTLPDTLKNLPSPKRCAMWGLRYSFKRQILRGRRCAINLRIRNDIAGLILAVVVAMPSWNLVSSGIAEDIVNLLPAVGQDTVKIWTEDMRLTNNDEDLIFKGTLLLIVAHLAESDTYVYVMRKATIMPIVLRIVRAYLNDDANTGCHSLILLERATHILSLLAPRMTEEFARHEGTVTLSLMTERISSTGFDENLAMILSRGICSIILRADRPLLDDFRKHELVPLLLKVSKTIINLGRFTMRRQRALTLLLIALEGLVKGQTSAREAHGDRSVELVAEIFAKCLHQKNEDSQVDQRLLLAAGSYVWESLARCPASLRIFLESGQLYAMLDIIEIASHPVKCLYLGALTDMCDRTFCGPFLCTWRGADKKTGLMSLLATVWREEEDRLGIGRHADGSVADPELPQIGRKQWADTYRKRLTVNSCPTMVDMFGSVRPKIFGIVKIIERDNDKYEIARKHYKIPLGELPTGDRVTLCCVDAYLRLKLGQMWTELSRYLEQSGVVPLSVDAHLIAHMVRWHRTSGVLIEERQKKLVAAARRAEVTLETDEFARIRDSKLAPTLDALDEVDRVRRTTDRSYMLRKKDRQRRQVDAALSFPRDADKEHCHRTFSSEQNVTVILGQHQSIDCTPQREDFGRELPPVSPPDSPHEEAFPWLDDASSVSPFSRTSGSRGRGSFIGSLNI